MVHETPAAAEPTRGSRGARALAVVALTTAYLAYVFQVTTGLPRAYGLSDWLDTYFINALLEHWYFSALRMTDPLSPPMFFPAEGTLGYSHGLILFAPFYLAVRPFVDAFLAHTLAIGLVMALGAGGLYVLLRRAGLGAAEAIVVGALFVTSANVVNGETARWSQRASVFVIPPILLIVSTALRMPPGGPRLIAGGVGGLLAALLFTQDFYTGAFAALLGVLLLPCAVFRRLVRRSGPVRVATPPPGAAPSDAWLAAGLVLLFSAALIAIAPIDRIEIAGVRFSARDPARPMVLGLLLVGWYAGRRWRIAARVRARVRSVPAVQRHTAAAIATGAAVGTGIFLWGYLPSYLEHRAFPHEQLWAQMHRPTFAWGSPADVIRDLVAYPSVRTFALAAIVATLAWLPGLRAAGVRRAELAWLAAISLVVLAIPLRTDAGSIWETLFAWMPGLSAIRDPKRIVQVYELAAVLVLGVILARLPGRSALRIAAVALSVLLLAVDWNSRVFDYSRSREQFERWVRSPIAIDPSCRSFFVKTASDAYMSRSDHMYSLYAGDALFVALQHRIPTLNGYSAWVPPEFRMLHPNDADYLDHVRAWMRLHGLRDVCALDMDARTMTPFAE